MDFVLYVFGCVGFAAFWAAVYSLAGQTGRLVITGGLYHYHPDYLRPRRARGYADHRPRTAGFDALALIPPTRIGLDDTPTEVLPAITREALRLNHDTYVQAQLEQSQTGAEHWGDLLRDMGTEERVIIHEETYLLHQDLRAITDPLLDDFDQRFAQLLANWAYRTEHVSLGSAQHATGAWPLVAA
jgi:hypothetical protein